jgi:hypothetical protein
MTIKATATAERGVTPIGTHFRTFTVVAEIDDDSDLRYVGSAAELVRKALEPLSFVSLRVRNEPNETGDMPPWATERGRA